MKNLSSGCVRIQLYQVSTPSTQCVPVLSTCVTWPADEQDESTTTIDGVVTTTAFDMIWSYLLLLPSRATSKLNQPNTSHTKKKQSRFGPRQGTLYLRAPIGQGLWHRGKWQNCVSYLFVVSPRPSYQITWFSRFRSRWSQSAIDSQGYYSYRWVQKLLGFWKLVMSTFLVNLHQQQTCSRFWMIDRKGRGDLDLWSIWLTSLYWCQSLFNQKGCFRKEKVETSLNFSTRARKESPIKSTMFSFINSMEENAVLFWCDPASLAVSTRDAAVDLRP